MEWRKLKDKATEAFTKGRFSKAAELYAEYCKAEPRDFQAHLRMGDAWAKGGHPDRAISAYQLAAEGFAREGFLPRAIAASKLILELDSSHRGVQQMLANLYARRVSSTPSVAPPGLALRATPQPSPPAATGPAVPPPVMSDPQPPRPLVKAASGSAPPGLRPRRTWAPESEGATGAPARAAASTEQDLEADSLLHTVESAALAGMKQRAAESAPGAAALEEDEETVFSLTEEVITDTPRVDVLPDIPLFSDLPREAFIELFERCPLRRFSQGERIIEQGSYGDAFYVICEGSVRVSREQEGGQSKELAVLGGGAFFGEMALLSGAPRMASAESVSEDTQLLEISAHVLAELSRQHPPVARALKKFYRERLLSNVMSTSALFRPFGRKDRRALVERFRARDVKKHEVIIREGDWVDGLYVVLSGEVEAFKGDQILSRLREGDLFGEISLLQKVPATATVRASRRTSLLRLPREDFDSLILSHPQILELVAELSDQRLNRSEALLGEVAAEARQEELLLV